MEHVKFHSRSAQLWNAGRDQRSKEGPAVRKAVWRVKLCARGLGNLSNQLQ